MTKYSEDILQKVWEKALTVPGMDEDLYRKDYCGAIIRRDMYGMSSESLSYGWEVNRIRPAWLGGESELNNLQPLHWENNRSKGNNYPAWSCMVLSESNENVYAAKVKDLMDNFISYPGKCETKVFPGK